MIKTIAYGGHSANPSDYASVDGDLSLSMGVINEDGALRPIAHPKQELTFPEGSKVMHIHETPDYRHFIYLRGIDNNTEGDDEQDIHMFLCWKGESNTESTIHDFGDTAISDVKSLGNTLIVCASDGVHYILWEGEADGYKYLGTSIPELPLSFGLQGEEVESDTISYSFTRMKATVSGTEAKEFNGALGDALKQYSYLHIWGYPDISGADLNLSDVRDAFRKGIKERTLSSAIKMIAEESVNKGRFIFPFFVRYAYRLYDQTLLKHSAPILMLVSNPAFSALHIVDPKISYHSGVAVGDIYDALTYKIKSIAAKLDYCTSDKAALNKLDDWKDIVESVDVFISAPIYNFDEEGKFILSNDSVPSGIQYFVGKVDDDGYYKHIVAGSSIKPAQFELSRDEMSVIKDIKGCSSFYLLKSIKIADISDERKIIEINDDYLQSLQTKEVMTDDFNSHNVSIAQSAIVYNGRLTLCSLRESLFDGFNAASLFPFTDRYASYGAYAEAPIVYTQKEQTRLYVAIKKDNKDIVVKGGVATFGLGSDYFYFYYPDSNAYEAVIEIENFDGAVYYKFPLEKHDFLNGAYYYGNLKNTVLITPPTVSAYTDKVFELPNRIYTSPVNNPFTFPADLITVVGSSRVISLAIAKQTISPNEFGQFPMYAFTEEGVWALGVNSEGAFTPAQPITSDVLINDRGILSLDNSVIYSTARGLMLLSGTESQCISDGINADKLYSLADLPRSEGVRKVFAKEANYDDTFYYPYNQKSDVSLLPFLDFIRDSEMVYDYVHQHILIFNPSVAYAYVYSLKSKMWGMTSALDFMYVVPSSTNHAYAMYYIDAAEPEMGDDTQSLRDYSKSDGENVRSLVITRPIKLDDPFDFQTISTIIQRGQFERNAVQQVLYGTNDYEHWFVVWSSKDKYMRGFSGSPYKAYRIVFMATMRPSDNIYGATIEYKPKLTNKPR